MSKPAAGAITCPSCVELNKLFQSLALDAYTWAPMHNCGACGGTGTDPAAAPASPRTDDAPTNAPAIASRAVGPQPVSIPSSSGYRWGDLTKVGPRLESWRRQRRRSQRELAELSGVSVRRIRDIERGATEATDLDLITLAHALRVEVDDLTGPRRAVGRVAP